MDDFDLILQNGLSGFRRSHGPPQNLHTVISSQASQIGTFLDDEAARAAFLTNFTKYASHLVEFLEFNDKMQADTGHRAGSKTIPSEVLVLVCSMLACAEFDLVDVDAMDNLVIAAIKHALPLQPAMLKVIATRLAEKPRLLERVTSGEEGAEVICDLFSVHFVSAVPSISEGWARKLIGLCSVCAGSPICHGVPTEVEKWRALTETIVALEEHQRENCQASEPQHTRTPVNAAMRKLNADDKKSYFAGRRRSSVLEPEIPPLSDRVLAMLNGLNLQQPTTSRAIAVLLDQIRATEIPAVLRAVLPTFPCRPCHDLSQDPKALVEKDKQITRVRADSGFSSGEVPEEGALFGMKIGLWKVLLSAAALKDIQRQMLGGYKEVLEDRLRRLASGNWKGGKLSSLAGTAAQRKYLDPPVLEAAVEGQLRILWQLGAGPTEDGNYRQHIKIWRVVETDDVPKAIDHVVMVWRTKILQPEDDPAFSRSPIWDEASGIYHPRDSHNIRESPQMRVSIDTSPSPSISIDDRRELEDYNRFFELTKPVMDSFLTDSTDAEFLFDASPEEIKVIEHSDSGTLIRGRSGTGKTTCLVHKLVRSYTSQKRIIGQLPRQILLTRSKLLVEKLKLYTKRLVETQLSQAISTQAHSDDFTLDEENLMFSKTIGSLQDDDFPLVCTFDQLLKLLENTAEDSNRQKFSGKQPKPTISAVPGRYVRRSQVVDFALFKSEYWKQFPSSLARRYEPGLVFAEILGVIKGSVSNEGELGTLSRDDYLALSHRKAPTFLSEERQEVYDIYLRYESRKARNGDRDGIDRVASLLKFMRTADPDCRRMVETFFGEIYVDEVQDQRCMDITLLLKLVQSPSGVHFAGDSAQCISRDSTFRFSDVKAMFYHQFKPLAEATGNNNLVHPKLFDLNTNFRSHQGIVSLASFVMELLYKGFPHSVDKMEKEKGRNGGSIPTMFVGWGAEVLAQRLVGPTDVSGGMVDFGAEQVILVRDEVVKKEVQRTLGEDTPVLSILDSKGMEFDDVFLLDFFTSSPTPSGLRTLKYFLVPGSSQEKIERDALLCSELKHLYVAITRTRMQLWILESSVTSAEPIAKLVAGSGSNPLVEVVRRNDPDAEEKLKEMIPAASSDPKRFSDRGHQFLQRGLYKEASYYFRRAKDSRGQAIAKAHLKMEEGRVHRGEGSTKEFLRLFREAVELFREASQFGNAAFCLEDMNCLEEAGDVWVSIGHHDKAASLYKQWRSWYKAHQCYDTLRLYAEAADALRQGELFDELIPYLRLNREHLEPSKVAAYSKLCTILLSQGRIKEEHQEFIFDSLGSDQEKEEFLRKFRLGKQLAKVLVEKHDYREAFHEHILDGRIAEALELGLQHFHDESSVPSKELLLPLHFIEFERLLETLGRIPGEDKQSRPYNSLELPHDITSALSEWASIRDQLRSSKICDVFSALPEGLHKDIFAILMVVNWRDLKLLDGCESVALIELRGIAQALIRAVSIWGSGRDRNKELPLSTAIVMGAFSLRDTQQMWHLQYSPIREGQPGQSLVESKTHSITIQNKLLVRMLELLLELDQTAKTIWDPVAGDLCSDHISRGNCTNSRCPNRHTPPSSAECRSRIEGLEMMSSLVCSFNIVYVDLRHNKFGGEEVLGHFSKNHQPQKRRWLEYFLKEAVFRSAIQHDCDASTNVMSNIASGRKEYAAIFYGLESLLFHRLQRKTRESHLRKDLSSIFEQLQLSESLAPSVAGRFRRYAKPIFHRPSAFGRLGPKEVYENELFEAFHGLNTLMNDARTNAAPSFRFNLNLSLGKLSKLPLNDFTCFHSIVGIFERLAAFLMLWTCQSTCVFPASWIKIHLPVLIRHPDQVTWKQPERDIYGDCLITLLGGFMSLLERLSAAPPPFNQRPHESFQFTYGTRKINNVPHKARTFGQGIQERNRNLLAIAVIHLTSMNAPLRGTRDVCERAQQLFLGRYLVARFYRGTTLGMLESLHASFAQYAGKDSLAFVNIKDKPLPAVFSPLSACGVPTYTLASLTESAKPHWMPSGDTAEESDGTSHDVVVMAAVRKLQAFWRRRGPYLPKHRLSLELPRGKESAFIFNNIIKPSLKAIREQQQQLRILKISHEKEPDELSDHGEEGEATKQDKPPTVHCFIPGILAKTMVLDTVGVDFFVTLGNLRKDATMADKLSQRVLTDSKIPSSAVEKLIKSNDMAELNKIVKTVSREMLAVKEVAEIYADPKRDSQELERRLVREKDKAEITRCKLMDIVKRLERILKKGGHRISDCHRENSDGDRKSDGDEER